jgi:hypothetical protein
LVLIIFSPLKKLTPLGLFVLDKTISHKIISFFIYIFHLIWPHQVLESHNYFHYSVIFVLTRGVARIIIVCSPNLHLPPFCSSSNVYYLPSISFKFINFTPWNIKVNILFSRNEGHIYIYITKSNIFFIPSHFLPRELICFVSLNIFILNNSSILFITSYLLSCFY